MIVAPGYLDRVRHRTRDNEDDDMPSVPSSNVGGRRPSSRKHGFNSHWDHQMIFPKGAVPKCEGHSLQRCIQRFNSARRLQTSTDTRSQTVDKEDV